MNSFDFTLTTDLLEQWHDLPDKQNSDDTRCAYVCRFFVQTSVDELSEQLAEVSLQLRRVVFRN